MKIAKLVGSLLVDLLMKIIPLEILLPFKKKFPDYEL